MERRHAALAERAARGQIGFSAGAHVAVDVAVHHPDVSGAAGATVDTGLPIPGGHGLHQIRASLHEALRFLARRR